MRAGFLQEERIFTAALDSFERRGYRASSMRDIAEAAGVSIGLPNHYFGSKENLGALVMRLLAEHTVAAMERFIRFEDDAIAYDMAVTRLNTLYELNSSFREFYLDSLRYDFFFSHLNHRPSRLIMALQEPYNFTTDADTALLYGRYIPYSVEKTIVLKKEEGLFPTIRYDDLPWHICYASLGRFIPDEVLREKDELAREYVRQAMKALEPKPSAALIRAFLEAN